MDTVDIYKDRNDNLYVQAGDYKVRIADGTRHDGTTIGHFELVKKLTIPNVVRRSEQYFCCKDQINQRCNEQCLGCFQFQNKD